LLIVALLVASPLARTASTRSLSNESRQDNLLAGPAMPCAIFTKLSGLIPDGNKIHFSDAIHLSQQVRNRVEECLVSGTGCAMREGDSPEALLPNQPRDNALNSMKMELWYHRMQSLSFHMILFSILSFQVGHPTVWRDPPLSGNPSPPGDTPPSGDPPSSQDPPPLPEIKFSAEELTAWARFAYSGLRAPGW